MFCCFGVQCSIKEIRKKCLIVLFFYILYILIFFYLLVSLLERNFIVSNYNGWFVSFSCQICQFLFRVCVVGTLNRLSCVQLFAILWTVDHHVPLSMGFSRREYWSGLPCPPPGDHPGPGIKPATLMYPALAGGSLPLLPPGKLFCFIYFDNLQVSIWLGLLYLLDKLIRLSSEGSNFIDSGRRHKNSQHRKQYQLFLSPNPYECKTKCKPRQMLNPQGVCVQLRNPDLEKSQSYKEGCQETCPTFSLEDIIFIILDSKQIYLIPWR